MQFTLLSKQEYFFEKSHFYWGIWRKRDGQGREVGEHKVH